jgi:hypothetical protein
VTYRHEVVVSNLCELKAPITMGDDPPLKLKTVSGEQALKSKGKFSEIWKASKAKATLALQEEVLHNDPNMQDMKKARAHMLEACVMGIRTAVFPELKRLS